VALIYGDLFISLFVKPDDRNFNEIPGLLGSKANAGIRYKARNNVGLVLFAQAVSSQKVIDNNNTLYDTDQTARHPPGYLRWDFEGRYPLSSFLDINVFFRNILNVRYPEKYGFPAAGRNIGVSLRLIF
jgi:outer membrane cobalamin receptor